MSTDHLLRDFDLGHPDKLCYEPPEKSYGGKTQDYLVFFISGNPGLISYYEPFLSRLHLLRAAANPGARFHICGHSYKGFEISPESNCLDRPVGLEEQIRYQETLLYHHVERHTEIAGNPPKVILIGHSVGAYVLLELIRRHQETMDRKAKEGIDTEDPDLIGGILLFPTIAEIAKSPLGRFAKVSHLCIPDDDSCIVDMKHAVCPSIAGIRYHHGCSCKKFDLLPTKKRRDEARPDDHKIPWIRCHYDDFVHQEPNWCPCSIVRSLIMHWWPTADQTSRHLAKDEMEIITKPKWQDEVWGAATSPGTNERDTINSNIFAYWGESVSRQPGNPGAKN